MPLQNRVDPFGELFAHRARGQMMGNRGGHFHRDDRTLSSRRWVSRQWICCVLDFKGRQRDVWGRYYTELFFLDEVTALAAGHRPCFECRRAEALAFARTFPRGPMQAAAMDEVLHAERLDEKRKRRHRVKIDGLPDGTVLVLADEPYAVRGKRLLRWTPRGYVGTRRRPRGISVDALTPPSIVAALKRGYVPRWHESAER